MHREKIVPRLGWQERMESLGFHYHSLGGSYWDESACYRFTAHEIDELESVTGQLHEMCLAAVEEVIRNRRFAELAIPDDWIDPIIASWEGDHHSLYGRFDLRYDGKRPAKLLEYNADTPTMLLESSVAQWDWLREVRPDADQFNSLHEKLIERWRFFATQQWSPRVPVHFSCVQESDEDRGNVDYLRDTAMQAGIDARFVPVEEIGWDESRQRFVDEEDEELQIWFKLYPWEWLVREEFGRPLAKQSLRIVEPPWKMILSNKAILPLLWQMYPNHPNLLPSYFSPARLPHFVKKPRFGREGADITIHGSRVMTSEGAGYGEEGFVYQEYAELPCFDGRYAVVGSWIVGDDPAGIGVREDRTPITQGSSHFVPHYFE